MIGFYFILFFCLLEKRKKIGTNPEKSYFSRKRFDVALQVATTHNLTCIYMSSIS